ncbi:MAG: hypothetical protein DBX53_05080 [Clostridiales bacterium]|nr:MAG: hypothetical protein DBX53_05080 [Clostridiales bacterium]
MSNVSGCFRKNILVRKILRICTKIVPALFRFTNKFVTDGYVCAMPEYRRKINQIAKFRLRENKNNREKPAAAADTAAVFR